MTTKEYNPLVSVIVPSYNHGKYVTRTIESIFEQTYKNIEVFVIDDGSTDDSISILENLNKQYPFKLVTQKNRGLSATLNRGIKEFATGELIAALASDDYWETNKLMKQVPSFVDREVGLCYSKAKTIKNNVVVGEIGRAPDPHNPFMDLLTNTSFIPALTALMRNSVIAEVGYYDENSYIEDWDMFLKIFNTSKVVFINDSLAFYRIHGYNMSSNHLKMVNAILHIVNKWKHVPSFDAVQQKWHILSFMRLAFFEKKEALKYLPYALKEFYTLPSLKGLFKLIIPSFKF